MTAKEIIEDVLEDYDVEDFVSPDWTDIVVNRIIADLAFHHFKIVKMEPATTPHD